MNPSFEQQYVCPTGTYQADTALYWDWVNHVTLPAGNWCKGSLMSTCCTSTYCSVPDNWFGYQKPKTGNSYIILVSINSTYPPSGNRREYLKGQLKSTLVANKIYCLTFNYNATNKIQYATNRFGAYVDDGTVASYNCCKEMPETPQAQNNPLIFMTDTANWVKIQGSFTAIGNENTITLGNFVDSATIQFQLFNSSEIKNPYYALDDISLIPIDLVPSAGKDSSITLGDSAYIGRPSEVGLDDDCVWYVQGNITPFDTVAGLWVKPNTLGTHSYVVEQNICSTITYDTVVVTVNPVGIEQFTNKKTTIKIYPNPASNSISLNINATSNYQNSTITIQNTLGQTIKKIPFAIDISVSDLAGGCYFLQVTLQNGEIYKTKFVKQ